MFTKRWFQIIVLVSCLLTIQITVLAGINTGEEHPDIFSNKSIRIEENQTVERLLVSSGNAFVAGTVKEGIIIVDGNLTLAPEARVGGRIVVLGGQIHREAGSYVSRTPWVIAPGDTPFTTVAITAVLFTLIASLLIIPYLFWAILHILRNVPLYLRVKNWFLEIQRRWPAMYIAITLAISALMLLTFSQLAWYTIFRSTMDVFDNIFIWLVRYSATPGLDQAMILLTNLGYGYTYMAMVLLALGVLAFLRRWLEMQALVICLMGGAVLNELLKHVFQRARPEALRLVEAWGYSFPSGHAMVSLCFYGMIAFLIARNIHSWHGRIAIDVIAVLLINGIGISRVYLGVHYPSDVIAGYAAGATWLAFSISLLMWWEQRQPRSN